MIVGIYGLAGAGKTLLLTRQVATYDVIVCNYKLNEQYFYQVKGFGKNSKKVPKPIFYVKDVEDFFKLGYMDIMRKYSQEGKQVILAIDEAGLFFPAQTFREMPTSFMYLFAQHRKLGIDFYYTAQHTRQVNMLLRVNTMYSYAMYHIARLFYFATYGMDKINVSKYLLWRGFFFARNIDYLRYDTKQMLEGADWYIRNTEKMKEILLVNDILRHDIMKPKENKQNITKYEINKSII